MTVARTQGRRRTVLVLLLPLALALSGCNIFSWTHDEGGSDDAETLLRDAEDALLDRDWNKALEFARKGIAADPAPMQFPRLRYVAAQAVLAKSGISISTYLNVFTNQGKANSPRIAYELLDLTLAELRAIAESCPQAVAFLRQLLDALENGDIGPDDLLGIQFDVDVGFGIGSLLTAFVTLLDNDQNLANGFVQDDRVTIEALDDGGYTLAFAGPQPDAYLRCSLLFPIWPLVCDALEGVYDAYRGADPAASAWRADLGCDFDAVGALPGTPNDSFVIGQVLDFVHDGISRLFTDRIQGQGCSGNAATNGGAQ